MRHLRFLKLFPLKGNPVASYRELPRIKFGGTLTVSMVIYMLLEPFIKVVITKYIGLAEVTYFEIANRSVTQIRQTLMRFPNCFTV